jgi:hypothetical protein
MIDGSIEVRAFNRWWVDDIGIFLRQTRQEGATRPTRYAGRTVIFEPLEPCVLQQEPTFTLDLAEAQRLMDELWNCGCRPTQGKQSEGVTAAQGRHLEDMRALAFTKLNVERPA